MIPLIRRRNLIVQLIQGGAASTQEDLVSGLASQGISVTQGTVSRDLSAIGAVKTPAGYRLPHDLSDVGADPMERLARALAGHAASIVPAGSLVVIRTAPGHAGVVGDALDEVDLDELLGTIAGDDTIFVATASVGVAEDFARTLNGLAAGEGVAS